MAARNLFKSLASAGGVAGLGGMTQGGKSVISREYVGHCSNHRCSRHDKRNLHQVVSIPSDGKGPSRVSADNEIVAGASLMRSSIWRFQVQDR
jgi:hypothetical protein